MWVMGHVITTLQKKEAKKLRITIFGNIFKEIISELFNALNRRGGRLW